MSFRRIIFSLSSLQMLSSVVSGLPLKKLDKTKSSSTSLISLFEKKRSQSETTTSMKFKANLKSLVNFDESRMCLRDRKSSLESALCRAQIHNSDISVHDYRKWNHNTKKMYTEQELRDLNINLESDSDSQEYDTNLNHYHNDTLTYSSFIQEKSSASNGPISAFMKSKQGLGHPALAPAGAWVLKTVMDACSSCHLWQCSPGLCYAGSCPTGSPSVGLLAREAGGAAVNTVTVSTTPNPCPSSDFCWNPSPLPVDTEKATATNGKKYRMCFGDYRDDTNWGFSIEPNGMLKDPSNKDAYNQEQEAARNQVQNQVQQPVNQVQPVPTVAVSPPVNPVVNGPAGPTSPAMMAPPGTAGQQQPFANLFHAAQNQMQMVPQQVQQLQRPINNNNLNMNNINNMNQIQNFNGYNNNVHLNQNLQQAQQVQQQQAAAAQQQQQMARMAQQQQMMQMNRGVISGVQGMPMQANPYGQFR